MAPRPTLALDNLPQPIPPPKQSIGPQTAQMIEHQSSGWS